MTERTVCRQTKGNCTVDEKRQGKEKREAKKDWWIASCVCVANVECRVELLGLADGVVPRVQGASIGEQ